MTNSIHRYPRMGNGNALIGWRCNPLIWLLVLVIQVNGTTATAAICEINSDALSISFNGSGGAERITAKPGNVVVPVRPDMAVFTLITHDDHGAEVKIPLSTVESEGVDHMVAMSADGLRQIHVVVSRGARHIALHLAALQNIAVGNGADSVQVAFYGISGPQRLHAVEMDWMEDLREGGDWFECRWSHLDHAVAPGNLGGVALYSAKSDDDEDEALARVWADAQIAHPKTGRNWDYDAVRTWMGVWQRDFADRSQMILEGKDLAELRAAIPLALRMQAKEIYLFTQTWRTDNFWPGHNGHVHINRAVFPAGDVDLRAFSDELMKKGIFLKLHYVSGGIGKDDERYIGTKPDRRLATWVHGTLTGPITADQQDVRFSPAPAEVTVLGEQTVPGRPKGLPDFMEYHSLRIGDELIDVGTFVRGAAGGWILKGVRRGAHGTQAVAHPQGEEAVGLIVPYDQVFVPDNDSTLLEEIAHQYAHLLESCHIANAEYDGAEIHCYDGNWGYRKFATLVYQELTHPVTAHDSSGRAPECHFEYRFNSSKRLMRGTCPSTHGGWNAPVVLDTPSREATRMLDAHYLLSQGHWGGAQGISKPEPMFSVSVPMLARFGYSNAMFQAIADWKDASRLMRDDQHARIQASFTSTQSHMPECSQHPVSAVVQVVRKTAYGYVIVPVRVLTRATGDIPWQQGQEHGPLSPRQYLIPGERVELNNPEKAQIPHVIMRVLWEFRPQAASTSGEGGKDAPVTAHTPSDTFTAGNGQSTTATMLKQNLLISPPSDGVHDQGSSQLTVHGEVLTVACNNAGSGELWECRHLPSWGCDMDMVARRGIGMEVVGDGKGAVLLLQITGRDYAIPIDFVGKRWIEIPNGEVAWSQACWGWRMDTKSCDYGHIRETRLGFGFVPPHTATQVTVSRLQALGEVPVTIHDPILHLGQRKLRFKGIVASGELLSYDGGTAGQVLDANGNALRELPLAAPAERVPTGMLTVWLEVGDKQARPWIELQVMTEGEPMRIMRKSSQ